MFGLQRKIWGYKEICARTNELGSKSENRCWHGQKHMLRITMNTFQWPIKEQIRQACRFNHINKKTKLKGQIYKNRV